MATHSSTLAWKIPWTEEPGRLQSMGSLRAGHDWASSLSVFTFMHWRRKCNPLQCSCLENPRDGGAWWAAISGVAQTWTQLKQLSSSSSSSSRSTELGTLLKPHPFHVHLQFVLASGSTFAWLHSTLYTVACYFLLKWLVKSILKAKNIWTRTSKKYR